jgi:hypothetical protein
MRSCALTDIMRRRVPQELARDDDCVSLPGNQDVLGLNGRCDHPDSTGQDVGFPADFLRKLGLITRTDGNLRLR